MKTQLRCPAGERRIQNTTGNKTIACRIIISQHLSGSSNIEHWEVVPVNCEDDNYLECPVWREECEKGWREQIGSGKRYTTLEQKEKIIV